ncbi:MAG TPA: hypothetical protein VFT27_09695, partial [Actinomycetota bacterium]|nr:hypothetical protein [Actinomycetota bacterium]
ELAIALGDAAPLEDALAAYRVARAAWVDAAEQATGTYVDDLTFGPQAFLRGTWADRLPAIDRDLDAMVELADRGVLPTGLFEDEVRRIVAEIGAEPPAVELSHTPPSSFRPGEPLALEVSDPDPSVAEARLRFRHLDQAERWEELDMTREADRFVATIPGTYSDSPYALQYHFVIADRLGRARLSPGLGNELSERPYHVVRQEQALVRSPD